MTKHAFLSASSAHRWTRCYLAPWREKDFPDETSKFAQEGIAAHEMLNFCIRNNIMRAGSESEMGHYIASVIQRIAQHGADQIYSEQELDISFITGEEGAKGTADVVMLKGNELIVVDLKYGMGVQVSAEENEQLLIYGAAALKHFDLLGEINKITLVIDQPRLNHVSAWELTPKEMGERIARISEAAKIILAKGGDLSATPGAEQCRFCKARGTCPEQRQTALSLVTDDFVDINKEEAFLAKVRDAELRLKTSDDKHLATCWLGVDMIEGWCNAVRNEVAKRALNGNFTDKRIKVVQGRRGHRKFTEGAEELLLKTFEGAETIFYKNELQSVAELEKTLGKEFPHTWKELQTYITQSEGKPIVVEASDKRPALDLMLDFEQIKKDQDEN